MSNRSGTPSRHGARRGPACDVAGLALLVGLGIAACVAWLLHRTRARRRARSDVSHPSGPVRSDTERARLPVGPVARPPAPLGLAAHAVAASGRKPQVRGFHRAGGALRSLVLLAGLALTVYAAFRLFDIRPVSTAVWFVGSAILHDLVLFPLYAVTDAALVAVLRRWPALGGVRGVPWINHLRFPVVASGILLLVWTPLIFRLSDIHVSVTGLSTAPYPHRWVWITVVLFTSSALVYLLRLLGARRSRTAPTS